MNYPKSIFVGIFLLLSVSSCKLEEIHALDETDETSTVEEQADSYIIVTNPNGILLYEKQFDLKSKRTVIPQGTRLYLDGAESESDTNFYWSKTSYKKRTGFIISALPEMSYLEFRKINEEVPYSLTQEEVVLKELPILESKSISKIPRYSILENLTTPYFSVSPSIHEIFFKRILFINRI